METSEIDPNADSDRGLIVATGSVPFCFRLTEMYVVIKKGGENFFFLDSIFASQAINFGILHYY